jgi:hypothetical protein
LRNAAKTVTGASLSRALHGVSFDSEDSTSLPSYHPDPGLTNDNLSNDPLITAQNAVRPTDEAILDSSPKAEQAIMHGQAVAPQPPVLSFIQMSELSEPETSNGSSSSDNSNKGKPRHPVAKALERALDNGKSGVETVSMCSATYKSFFKG